MYVYFQETILNTTNTYHGCIDNLEINSWQDIWHENAQRHKDEISMDRLYCMSWYVELLLIMFPLGWPGFGHDRPSVCVPTQGACARSGSIDEILGFHEGIPAISSLIDKNNCLRSQSGIGVFTCALAVWFKTLTIHTANSARITGRD